MVELGFYEDKPFGGHEYSDAEAGSSVWYTLQVTINLNLKKVQLVANCTFFNHIIGNRYYMKLLLRISIRISPFLYMGLIWFLSSHPSDAIIDTGFSFDSLLKEALHLIEFAILYILLIMAILTFGELASGASRLAAIWAIAYGFLDEFHQYFVPSRSATVIDLVKDTVGY